jgi:8-oxo-dGTP pyrophosphatase MutT (NUDIX family)
LGPDRRADLERRLRAYTPRDDREHEYRLRMLELVSAPGDPFTRERHDPGHFTASGFVLSPDGGSLMMILHAKLGRWLQPGGHVDPGDADVLAAARREVREEVAIDGLEPVADGVPFDLDVHPIPARGSEPGHEHFDVRFLFRAESTEFAPSPEVREARWMSLEELVRSHESAGWVRVLGKLTED